MGSKVGRMVVVVAAAAALCAAPAGAGNDASYAKGVDVSHYNGAVDWTRVVTASYKFVFAKATEGFTLIDPTYPINRQGTESLGIRFGAYHFARPSGSGDAAILASAIAQADFLVDTAQPQAGELPPVLDMESKGTLGPAALVKWTQAWLDEVYARTGVHPFIYASPSFWKTSLDDTSTFAANGDQLWIAHWTKNAAPLVPAANWNGLGWTFWQWSDCSAVPGFVHCSDADRYNGIDPTPVAIGPYPAGAPLSNLPPTVVGSAQAGKTLAGVPGTWSGGKPVSFQYQWLRCDGSGSGCLPISGATTESYKATSDDVGHALSLQVTASTKAGIATAASPATVAVAAAGTPSASRPQTITTPAFTGTAQVGQTLSGTVGTWTGTPTTYTYQWRRCDSAGASCGAIAGATSAAYTLTPGDIGATVSLVVTATGPGGSQAASTVASAVVTAAPIPQAAQETAVAQPGLAGAVVTTDARAIVVWQPGALPTGTTVTLDPADKAPAIAGTGVQLGLVGVVTALPWPVDLTYASPPAGAVLGTSNDGVIWSPVPSLPTPSLPAKLTTGTYFDTANVLHLLTKLPQRVAFFTAGAWGDPTLVAPGPPTIALVGPLRVKRSGPVLTLRVKLTAVSQSLLFAGVTGGTVLRGGSTLVTALPPGAVKTARATLLKPGPFSVVLRVAARSLHRGDTGHLRVAAIDPWGRKAQVVLDFRTP